MAGFSKPLPLTSTHPTSGSCNPRGQVLWFRLLPFRSPLLRESRLISFPGGNEMFQFPPFASPSLCIQEGILRVCLSGFRHSEISGSTAICASPKLIAACRVLHRRQMPRHPPCALVYFQLHLQSFRRFGERLAPLPSSRFQHQEPKKSSPAVFQKLQEPSSSIDDVSRHRLATIPVLFKDACISQVIRFYGQSERRARGRGNLEPRRRESGVGDG